MYNYNLMQNLLREIETDLENMVRVSNPGDDQFTIHLWEYYWFNRCYNNKNLSKFQRGILLSNIVNSVRSAQGNSVYARNYFSSINIIWWCNDWAIRFEIDNN
jgi:hypothetical protein